jgi:hypothetical protein
MYNVIDGKQTKLQDENFMGNFLEFTKDFFSISIKQNIKDFQKNMLGFFDEENAKKLINII